MSDHAGDIPAYQFRCAHRDRVELECVATIGASGAVNAPLTSQDDPNMSVAHGATGVYNLTFPPAGDAGGVLDVTVVSPAGTVKGFGVTAFSPTAGTAQVVLNNGAGTATDPASADVLRFTITLNMRKDF